MHPGPSKPPTTPSTTLALSRADFLRTAFLGTLSVALGQGCQSRDSLPQDTPEDRETLAFLSRFDDAYSRSLQFPETFLEVPKVVEVFLRDVASLQTDIVRIIQNRDKRSNSATNRDILQHKVTFWNKAKQCVPEFFTELPEFSERNYQRLLMDVLPAQLGRYGIYAQGEYTYRLLSPDKKEVLELEPRAIFIKVKSVTEVSLKHRSGTDVAVQRIDVDGPYPLSPQNDQDVQKYLGDTGGELIVGRNVFVYGSKSAESLAIINKDKRTLSPLLDQIPDGVDGIIAAIPSMKGAPAAVFVGQYAYALSLQGNIKGLESAAAYADFVLRAHEVHHHHDRLSGRDARAFKIPNSSRALVDLASSALTTSIRREISAMAEELASPLDRQLGLVRLLRQYNEHLRYELSGRPVQERHTHAGAAAWIISNAAKEILLQPSEYGFRPTRDSALTPEQQAIIFMGALSLNPPLLEKLGTAIGKLIESTFD